MELWLDRETKSDLDLKVVGTYQYAESARDILVTYAVDDGPVHAWEPDYEDPPNELIDACLDADVVWAANAQFDKAIHASPNNTSLPDIPLEKWRCSMALALSHALPGGLGNLCEALGLPEDMSKLKEGGRLIRLFCMPQPANRKIQNPTKHTHPAEWERFRAYAINDVVSMREAVRRMPRWNWDATAVAEWHCDQRINERGIYIDRELTRAGIRAAEKEKARISVRYREITGGINPGQREKVKEFVANKFGIELEDTKADTFLQFLKDPKLDPLLGEMMNLSMAANKTSTAKYAALDPTVQSDGRFRGALQFAGASRTRRWAGRIFQAQNLPARGLPPPEQVELYIEMLKRDSHDLWFDNLMKLGAAALRGCIISPPKKKMVVADLSNIEGRMLSWVSGESWKLEAFREYDTITGLDAQGKETRKGPDLYKVTAASILGGSPWDVNKKNRDVFGKVPDLASGYQGGVAGYQTFAKSYNVRMADYWGTIQEQIAPALIQKAHENLETFGRPQLESLEISEVEWLASESCKLAWRARHPATVKFWYALGDAAKRAISDWGSVHRVGQYLTVKGVGYKGQRWLLVKLPSGRYLTYFNPKLIRSKAGEGLSAFTITYEGEASEEGKTSRHWTRIFTHGGKMTGNVCQTLARDVLMPALRVAEDRGYMPILSVHDEALTEVPDTPLFTASGLVDILATNPVWAKGLPLAAAGFECTRYYKG